MARALFRDTIKDRAGRPIPNVTVHVYEAGTTTPVAATVYQGATGATTLANPFTTNAEGEVRFWLDAPQLVDVKYVKAGFESEASTVWVSRGYGDVDPDPSLDYTWTGAHVFQGYLAVPSSTKAGLPAAGTAGRLQRVTDDVRGLWVDTGTQWIPFSGHLDPQWFGAVPGGVTDNTAALQATFNAANAARKTLDGTNPLGQAPRVRFSQQGVYYVAGDITLPPYIDIDFQGSVIKGAAGVNMFKSTAAAPMYRWVLRNGHFHQGAVAVDVETNNEDGCYLVLHGCFFKNQTVAGLRTSPTSLSTHIALYDTWARFTDSATQATARILHLQSGDNLTWRGGWIHSVLDVSFEVSGRSMGFEDVLFVPATVGQTAAENNTKYWFQTSGANAVTLKLDGCRLGGEHSGRTVVNWLATPNANVAANDQSSLLVEDCSIFTGTKPMFRFEDLPNFCKVEELRSYNTGNVLFAFTASIPNATRALIGEQVRFHVPEYHTGRFDVLDENSAGDLVARLLTGNVYGRAGVMGVADSVLALTQVTVGFGVLQGTTNATATTGTDELGDTYREITATADNAAWFRYYDTAMDTLAAGVYTLVTRIEVITGPLSLVVEAGDHRSTMVFTTGTHIISVPFHYDAALASSKRIGLQALNMRNGEVFRVHAYRVVKGHVEQTTPYLVMYGTAIPTVGPYLVSDEVRITNPVPGGYTSYRCTTSGTVGTWKGAGAIAP